MSASHVIIELKVKRAELTGRIEATQRTLQELVIDLDHIDALLRIVDPDRASVSNVLAFSPSEGMPLCPLIPNGRPA